MKGSKTAGISLVALVITIIVLIILTGAVIATFMEGGIIDNAKESVFKNDIRTYQEILSLKRAEEEIEIATGTGEISKLNGEDGDTIQVFLPEFKKDEYEGIIIVVDGEIMLAEGYEDVASPLQQEWIAELGLTVKQWDNSFASVLVIDENGILSGFKEDLKEYYDEEYTYLYKVPEGYNNLIIPEGVTSINDEAFRGCTSIKNVKISKGVTSLGYSIFNECEELESVVIPEGITSISYYAFASCYNLKEITIPSTVTTIEDEAFYYCRSIENIIIPNNVNSIGIRTFAHCENLVSIVIPKGVTTIGQEAFNSCYNLKEIIIPSTVTTIDLIAFSGVPSDAKFTVGSEAVKTLVLNSESGITESQITVDANLN